MNLTINDRVKKIRTELGLTQKEFGKKITLAQTYLSQIEKNDRPVTDKIAKLICLEYGVSEEWLYTGKGDWRKYPEDTYIQNAYDLSGDEFIESFLYTYKQKSDAEKETLRNFIADLYNNMQKEKGD